MSDPAGPEHPQGSSNDSRPSGLIARAPGYSPWGVYELVLAVGANLLLGLALGGGALALYGTSDPFELPPAVLMLTRVLAWTGVFALLWVLASSRAELRAGLALHPTHKPYGFAVTSLALALAAAGMAATQLEGDSLAEWEAYMSRPGVFPVIALMALTAAPLFEELYFRGLIQGIAGRFLGPWPAVAVAALAFALPHAAQYGGAWVSMGVLVMVGVAAGTLRHAHGSIVPAIALHFLYNAFTLVGAVVVEVISMATR